VLGTMGLGPIDRCFLPWHAMKLQPLYTTANCTFSCPLQWGLSVLWRAPTADAGWLDGMAVECEVDGIPILRHRFVGVKTSQFLLSTTPHVAPLQIVQRVKGRLQYAVKRSRPKALKGNYAIRSVGKITRQTVEEYVAGQVQHHRFADDKFAERLKRLQFVDPAVKLDEPRWTSHGCYWYNLHVVLVREARSGEWRDDVLESVRSMILRSSRAKDYQVSRIGILPDHLHLVLSCPIQESPAEIVVGFLNNLAYVNGMRPVFQFGAFVGTVGEYTTGAVKAGTRVRRS
jgi:REP element-mobilizing transposase RayT